MSFGANSFLGAGRIEGSRKQRDGRGGQQHVRTPPADRPVPGNKACVASVNPATSWEAYQWLDPLPPELSSALPLGSPAVSPGIIATVVVITT